MEVEDFLINVGMSPTGAVQLKLSAEEVKSLEEFYQPRAAFGFV